MEHTMTVTHHRGGRTKEETQELYEVLKACNTKKPNPEKVDALRVWLRKDPALWREICDMGEHAAHSIAEYASGKNALIAESIKRGREVMLEELGAGDAPGLERILCEAVVLAWMRYADVERRYTQMVGSGELSIAQADYWERRASAAQRRYLRAAETLARIRKLQLPMVQVNIGEQQVNVAKGT